MRVRLFTLIVLCVVLYSCSQKLPEDIQMEQTYWIGKPLHLPLKSFKLLNKESETVHKADFELVHYINVDCSICIIELKQWAQYLNETVDTEKCKVSFVASGDSEAYLEYLITSGEIEFNYPIYFDSLNEFFDRNELSADKRFHTFVVDTKKEVQYIGNPLKISQISSLYSREIY